MVEMRIYCAACEDDFDFLVHNWGLLYDIWKEISIIVLCVQHFFDLFNFCKILFLGVWLVQNVKLFVLQVETAEAVIAIEAVHDVFAVGVVGAPVDEVAVVVFGGFDCFVDESGFVEHAGVDGIFHSAGIVHVHAVFEFM